jgi:hypothetical protein
VGAIVVVGPHPTRCVVLHIGQRVKFILRQPFVAHCPVEAFDVGILLRLAGMDEVVLGAQLLDPSQQRADDVFRPIVASDRRRFATPFNDLVEAADHPQRRQREIHVNGQSLAVEVVDHVEQAHASPIAELVVCRTAEYRETGKSMIIKKFRLP